MKKRLLISFLVLVLCMAGMPISVQAEKSVYKEEIILPEGLQEIPKPEVDPDEPESENSEKDIGGIQAFSMDADQNDIFMQLEERLKEALLNGDTEVSVNDMQISSENNLNQLRYYSPYLSNGINATFYYSSSSGFYTRVVLSNEMTVSETEKYFSQIDKKISDILALVSDDMPDEKKALIIHDYLVYESAYDYDNYLAGTLPQDSYRSGGLLMNGIGVCQAYAYAFTYLMDKVDIECYVTSSDEMNHAWNIVKIEGSYYHVDCTWDDPVYDKIGKVLHKYFLVSDEAIQDARVGSGTHTGWDLTDLVCDNTQYDDAYWVDIDSPIIFDENDFYYIEGSIIYKEDESTGDVTSLKNLGRWYVWDSSSSYWTSSYSGLFLYKDELYYNTSTEIRKIDVNGENDEVVYVPDTSDGYIYGTKRSGNEIQYVIKQSPNEVGTIYTTSLAVEEDAELLFTDVKEEHWYYEAVKYVYDQGIMSGLTETEFGPEHNITRSQFAAILYRIEGSPDVAYEETFSDVPDDMWYTDGIIWANKKGIVSGYADSDRFGVNDNITREQMASMMHRFAEYKSYNTNESADLSSFSDAAEVSEYAEKAMQWAVGSKIISGKENGTLDPLDDATRGEGAAIIMRFMENY